MDLVSRPSARQLAGRVVYINAIIWSHILTGIFWQWRDVSGFLGIKISSNIEEFCGGSCFYIFFILMCVYFWRIKPRESPRFN